MNRTYVSFDWAIKKMFRDKANFDVLEGFLSELLLFQVKIEEVLESEANKMTALDKYDKVDILVKSEKGELMLIEIQYDSEQDYFHRMLYGISKLISQYIQEGQPYGQIKKAYSINVLYFNLGQGNDYLYEYRGEFVGVNQNDVLLPSNFQKGKYAIEKVSDIFPKYYIIKAGNYHKQKIERPVEEWVYFLQNSDIPDDFKAQGMKEAREKLRYEKMPDIEKQGYQRFVENRRIEMAVTESAKEEGLREGKKEGIKEGREEGKKEGIEEGKKEGREEGKKEALIEIAKNMKKIGVAIEIIIQSTGLTQEEINRIEV